LWQAGTIRLLLSSTGTFINILGFQLKADGSGISLIGLWRQTSSKPTFLKSVSEIRRITPVLLISAALPIKLGLAVEVSCMWKCQTSLVPVVLGAFSQCTQLLDMIPGHHNLQLLQKHALFLGSVGILHKILSIWIAMMVLVPQKQGLLRVLAIDLADQI
jgi:hypothetical protein